jgi:hypothetical protein
VTYGALDRFAAETARANSDDDLVDAARELLAKVLADLHSGEIPTRNGREATDVIKATLEAIKTLENRSQRVEHHISGTAVFEHIRELSANLADRVELHAPEAKLPELEIVDVDIEPS